MFRPLLLASGSSSSSRNWSYDVFPSFSGEDVRKTFLSHFLMELERKSIVAFKDNEMERSHSISPKLVEAIRGSRIAVVVFSKNYASSSWCLNELLEILKCKEDFGQMVLPIFYDLDPSHVRKQMGDFGVVFKNTCENQNEKVKIHQWKKALTDAANLLGYHSMNWGSDTAGIKEISSDISSKLYSTPPNDFEDFVGIKDHIVEMISLLRLESREVRMVGIWGSSGIGKTTIARALFSLLSRQFQNIVFIDRAFISKSKEAYGRPYLYDHNMKLSLRENFLCKMNMKGPIEEKLKHRKILTIIDDLDDQYVLDALAGQTKWFGSGSRIIVVTTNKHLLKAHGIDNDSIYEVDLPSHRQALKIFCRAAFKQNFPPYGLELFASEVVQMAGNLPLGLTVLGSSFRGRDKEACLKMLPRLRRGLDGEIEETLRFSYDGLCSEEDKALFRHLACYFNYYDAENIKLFLVDSELDVNIGLDNLVDKSLIQERYGKVVMHKLLEKMGRNIVRKQSIDKPGKREFLMDSKDICHVLQKGTGTEKLLGILLNIDEIDGLHVHESAFTGMLNLRFLEIRNIMTGKVEGKLMLPESFNCLPHKLKLLIWPEYPMRGMPSNFCPESLVKLQMRDSKLETLWQGVMDLRCLKEMDLSNSPNLKEIPDLSMASNLEKLKLNSCESLVELPSSIRNLNKLIKLSMGHCTKLEILPTGINLKSLEDLSLGGCKMLKNFPEISTNILSLDMSGTSVEELPSNLHLKNLDKLYIGNIKGDQIRQGMQLLTPFMSMLSPSFTKLVLRNIPSLVELPSSFQNLNKLMELEIVDCVNLETLPPRINIKSLYRLDLSGCSRLRSFPDISRKIIDLNLSRTGIEEVPRWIKKFSRLQELSMESCSKLEYVYLNISKLKLLEEADFSDCGALTGVDLSGYAHGVAMQDNNIDYSSLPDNGSSKVTLKCRKRKRTVLLQFLRCFHLDHILLPPQHSVSSPMCHRNVFPVAPDMFKLQYRVPLSKNIVAIHATFARDSKFEFKKWGIRISKHCSSAHNRVGNENSVSESYLSLADKENVVSDGCHESEQGEECGHSNDSDTGSETDISEEFESSDGSDIGNEDISSPQNQFVNPNTLPHFTGEDNVVND